MSSFDNGFEVTNTLDLNGEVIFNPAGRVVPVSSHAAEDDGWFNGEVEFLKGEGR